MGTTYNNFLVGILVDNNRIRMGGWMAGGSTTGKAIYKGNGNRRTKVIIISRSVRPVESAAELECCGRRIVSTVSAQNQSKCGFQSAYQNPVAQEIFDWGCIQEWVNKMDSVMHKARE